MAVLTQTTQNIDWFKPLVCNVVVRFLGLGAEVHAHNTVCLPTAAAARRRRTGEKVDVIIAVGGYESAKKRPDDRLATKYGRQHHIGRRIAHADKLAPAPVGVFKVSAITDNLSLLN